MLIDNQTIMPIPIEMMFVECVIMIGLIWMILVGQAIRIGSIDDSRLKSVQ